MSLTKAIASVLCLLVFSTFPVLGKSEDDDEGLSSRLITVERMLSKQGQTIADQELRLTNQETRLIHQEGIIANLEKRLENQEKVEKRLENQDKEMSTQDRLTSNLNMENHTNFKRNVSKTLEDPSLEDRVNYLEEVAKIKVLRTCAEMEQHGVSSSGFYHLDPDGEMIGNPPIRAYCDFENKVTEILHDADNELIYISHCDSNLCFERDLVYTINMEQIAALMQLSTFCDQTIEFDCYMAPLMLGVWTRVWMDRHGEDQIYFDGENYGFHTCSCNSFGNCTGQENLHNTCNCDNIAIPEMMQDIGKLTNMSALPVMGFKFGPLAYETQQAKFGVGRLRCEGMKEVSIHPHTCRDLKLLGETRPGLYHLQDSEHGNYPKMSFCQLDQPGYGDDMETDSHWAKWSTGPGQVFFSAKNTGRNDISNGAVITYNPTDINEGAGMDTATGIFTAPVGGVYDFKLSGLTAAGNNIDPMKHYFEIDVYLNEAYMFACADSNVLGWNNFGHAWMFTLQLGDKDKLVKLLGGHLGLQYPLEWNGILI